MQVPCEICGTSIHHRHVAARVDARGKTCYFCCEACRRTFREHPDLFSLGHDLGDGVSGVGRRRVASIPHSEARHQASLPRGAACSPAQVSSGAKAPHPNVSHIGCELAAQLVAEAKAQLSVVEP